MRLAWIPLLVLACRDTADAGSVELPASLHGAYGRDRGDLRLGTLGLEISGKELRLGEMTMTVTAGKSVGETFQIDAAEVRWAKEAADKLPKVCKGTLSRKGARLLLSLFKKDSDEPCDSALAGEWTEWRKTTEFPAGLRGTWGASEVYGEDAPFVVGNTAVEQAGLVDPVVLKEGLVFADRDTQLVVLAATVGEHACKGVFELADGQLSGVLEAVEGEHDCPGFGGARWVVTPAEIPVGTFTNGHVTLTVSESEVVTEAEGTRCRQPVLRTSKRPSGDRAIDGLPVLDGRVLGLRPADPEAGLKECQKRASAVAQATCQAMGEPSCDAELFADLDVQCPSHAIVGESTSGGRNVVFLPHDTSMLACFDTSKPFREKGK